MGALLEIAERGYTAWNRGNIEESVNDISPDVEWIDPGLPEPAHGREAVRAFLEAQKTAFPDARLSIRNSVECGDAGVIEGTLSGTHTGPLLGPFGLIPPTGKRVTQELCAVIRVVNGKVVYCRAYHDTMRFMAQLGLVPTPAATSA